MIHDKTLLFSADSNVKTATLSEPLSAFERFAIVTTPNTYRESTVSANCNRRIDTIGTYNTDGYMIWPTNVVVGGDTTTLDVNHFQLLMQQATNTGTRTFGFNNTANNCKRILEVYGINRKDGTSAEGSGSPGSGFTAYNETLLASGLSPNMAGDIQLSDRANTYHRLKVGVGAYNENVNIYDVDSPVNWTGWLPLYSYWGTSTGSYWFSEHRYKFSNSATVLTPISGKTHQLGTAAANPYTTTGNYTAADTFIRHPLYAVWGINKKTPHTLTLLPPTAGGTQSASETSGYEYDQITMSNTPDEGWYFSGYNVTGATLNGNVITLQDQDASAQAGFTDQAFPVTYQNDGHGTLTGDTNLGIPGEPINLTTSYNTYYRFSGYQVTGGYIQDGKLYASAACTAKAIYKPNAFTATGTFNWSNWSMNATTTTKTYNAILKAFTGSKPSNWPATNGNWNVTNASAYGINASTKIRGTRTSTPNTWLSVSGRILIAGATKVGMSKGSQYFYDGEKSKDILTMTLSKNATQGQLSYSGLFRISSPGSRVTYTWQMPTNGWTATGYAP